MMSDTSATDRLQALKIFTERIDEVIEVGSLTWDQAAPDFRGLSINNCVRRQRESLEGAIALGRAGHGHLAVGFVRSFLEERIWLAFLASMPRDEANSLLLAMGRWDAIRTLVAQREFVGDKAMTLDLWYPPGFVDAHEASLPEIKAELRQLRAKWGWQQTLPSTGWVAEQVELDAEYEYLHSATSRALHFSAGEVLRRGWGTPGGILVTDKPEFRAHLADFAYDQLWRQHLGTLLGVADLLDESGVNTPDCFWSDESRQELTSELIRLGRVPLVHAHEWNLEPPDPGTRLAWAAIMLAKSPEAEAEDGGN